MNVIFICDWSNFKIAYENMIWGVKPQFKSKLCQCNIDGEVLFYITQRYSPFRKSIICGPFKIISDVFHDENKLFNRNDVFPFRVKIIPSNGFINYCEFKPLVEKLDFISNKTKWGMQFMGRSIIAISHSDFEYILEQLKQEMDINKY